MLISIATGAGVLLLLLIICLAIVCRRRKPLSRAVPLPQPVPRPDLADHAALLHHPDRLALIAYADGIQVGQVKEMLLSVTRMLDNVVDGHERFYGICKCLANILSKKRFRLELH